MWHIDKHTDIIIYKSLPQLSWLIMSILSSSSPPSPPWRSCLKEHSTNFYTWRSAYMSVGALASLWKQLYSVFCGFVGSFLKFLKNNGQMERDNILYRHSCPQRMNPADFDDPLSVPIAWHFWLLLKYFNSYWMDCQANLVQAFMVLRGCTPLTLVIPFSLNLCKYLNIY